MTVACIRHLASQRSGYNRLINDKWILPNQQDKESACHQSQHDRSRRRINVSLFQVPPFLQRGSTVLSCLFLLLFGCHTLIQPQLARFGTGHHQSQLFFRELLRIHDTRDLSMAEYHDPV